MMLFKRLPRLVVCLVLIFSLLSACSSSAPETAREEPTSEESTQLPPTEAAPAASAPTAKAVEIPAASATAAPALDTGDTWLVMLYQDADDEILEEDIFIDLNEAEMVGSTDQVNIIAQIDRMDGGYDGGGDWDSTKRFRVLKDDSGDLESLASEELDDLGEVDMGDKNSLVEFAVWAMQNYPADRYALILSDHGAGWTGGWTDNDPTPESQMILNHIDEALAEITSQTGVDQLDLIGFDACLMSQIDVLSAVAPYARYMVGSEETEPSLGWAYAAFLGSLTENPRMDGRALSKNIVESYIDEDYRLTDEEESKAFAQRVSNKPNPSSADLAEELSGDITLTALDLSKLEPLNLALNELVMALTDVDQQQVAEARAYAQSYTNIFDDNLPPSFIDLGHFASLLEEAFPGTPAAETAAAVRAKIAAMVVAEKHGPERPGSTGISLYFPDGDLYQQTSDPDEYAYYPQASGRFIAASLWDDFMTYHYTHKPVNPASADPSVTEPQSAASDFSAAIDASAPPAGVEVTSPGSGEIQFNDLTASAETISADDTLTLSVDLQGSNVGYIYLYTAYYDEASGSYLTTDLDFVTSEKTRALNGVYYPDWGDEDDLSMEVDWEPVLWLVSDGKTEALAAAEAETYGKTNKTTFYRVWGTYKPAGAKKSREAFLRFDANGDLDSVLVFSGSDTNATPREITPKKGDTFTVQQEWFEYTNDSEGEYTYYEGDTVTFGKDGFTLVAADADAGMYSVGIIVEDLDGNMYENYVEVEVK